MDITCCFIHKNMGYYLSIYKNILLHTCVYKKSMDNTYQSPQLHINMIVIPLK